MLRICYISVVGIIGLVMLLGPMARVLVAKQELAYADAIVILAGAVSYQERTGFAARLYHEGRAPQIILTDNQLVGGRSKGTTEISFIEKAELELQAAGVPKPSLALASLRRVSSRIGEGLADARYGYRVTI